jgi:hypothetical protein
MSRTDRNVKNEANSRGGGESRWIEAEIASGFGRSGESGGKCARGPIGGPRLVIRIDFIRVNQTALASLPALCERWLPDGRRCGREWIARNPRRLDRRPGSFKVNLITGRWADFALGTGVASGGDPISLAAYLRAVSRVEAANGIARMLGIDR